MKKLTKMMLTKWHYFEHKIIDFDDINFLTGKNSSGKSTLIDAMQVVLLGETDGTSFNKAADIKANRSFTSYIIGELGDDINGGEKSLRGGKEFTTQLVCEFKDTMNDEYFCIGILVDSYSDMANAKRVFFRLRDRLDESDYIYNNQPRNINQFKSWCREKYGKDDKTIKFMDTNTEYRQNILSMYNVHDRKMFTLLKKSISFKRIDNIENFITENICDVKNEIDIRSMQLNVYEYEKQKEKADQLEKQERELAEINNLYEKYSNKKRNIKVYNYISNRCEEISKTSEINNIKKEIEAKTLELNTAKTELEIVRKNIAQYNKDNENAIKELDQCEQNRLYDELTKNIDISSQIIDSRNKNINFIIPELRGKSAKINSKLNSLKDSIANKITSYENLVDEKANSFISEIKTVNSGFNSLINIKRENFNAYSLSYFKDLKDKSQNLMKKVYGFKTNTENCYNSLLSEKAETEEELKKLPRKPGVYIMRDDKDVILYVGKAINLHNRVRSYFRENIGRGPAIDQMVSLIARFEYIVTDSELEALVLENNLIKENSPKYNTLLKDDKTYPYIKVTVGEDYPRILFSRTMKKDKSRYFGPYTSAAAVKDTIELLNKLYQLRTCNRVLPRDTGLERPCLNYHIKQCLAPCQGYVSKEEYRQQVAGALEFLNGNYSPILKDLEEKMKKAAEAMEFEDAARYRDLLSSVRQVSQKQKITEGVGEDKDILALYQDETEAVVQVFFVRDGKLIGREHYYMTHVPENNKPAILQDFVKQFYAGTPFIPRELMLQYEIEDAELIEKWLSERKGSRVYLKVPKIGSKEKLVELAAQNAKLVLSQDREKLKREEGRTIGAVKEISDLLQLPLTGTARMEAYDISNINGFENVGSMVVYEKGKPKRSDYRKFKIKSVSGPDDYACMREVLTRRFRHGMEESKELEEQEMDQEYGSFTKFPDLILMDGGRGQVNIALSVLEELGIDIPVCGMVKDDNHRTRGLYYHNIELPIDTHSEGFKLITRIQDEAHRFAIEYHRSLRSKTQVKSVLDDIPGVGPARRKALMRHFKSLEEIRQASVEELMEIPEMNERTAEEIVTFFASQTGQPVVH